MIDLFIGPNSNGATFSPCRRYRYSLWREWSDGPTVTFIGLNPSTADETKDDPTIRRCIAFTKRFGGGRFVMLNLFAFRATDPREMYKASDPVGPKNDQHLLSAEGTVVAAWGVHGAHRSRGNEVLQMLLGPLAGRLWCLGLTKDGQPKHPLYLRGDVEPMPMA